MWNVLLLGLASFFADVSGEMIYPLLPLYLAAIGAGPATLGLVEGASEMLASLTKVASGGRSDRIGRRKPFALFGYGLAAVGKLLLVLAGTWPLVLVSRLADRFGKGVRGAPRDALIAERVPLSMRGQAFGLHRTLDTLGAVLGVAGAYLLVTFTTQAAVATYRRVFAVAVVPAVVSVVMLSFAREQAGGDLSAPALQPATKPKLTLRTLADGWSSLDRQLRAFLIVALLFTLGNSSNQFLLLRAGQLGDNPATVLLLYGFYNVIYAALSYPAGRLSDRIGRRLVLVAGYSLYGLVYLGFALVSEPALLWLLFGFYGAYTALTEGVEKVLLVDLAPSDRKGTLIGLHAALVGTGLLPASLLAGVLWNWLGPAVPFVFGGGVGLAAALGLWVVFGHRPPPAPPVAPRVEYCLLTNLGSQPFV